ncbi:class C beta-lactamase [Pseudomonas oryzicola]|uniref:Beta-lactamase n=1 Tax=Pseudomonas oryzicola TaxID=485876 RepID=A0ABS6QAX2_9PSED|nr:class C beta-lactamase [Pseudomonas oryzicola]MBV4491339.1 beta-lactamase [Pseudomonas oryzicola]
MPLPRLAAVAAALTFTLGHSAAKADDQLQAKVDRIIRPLMQEQGISGMAVAVYARDHAYYFSYGVASKDDPVPVSRDTLFEIGSLSKTYTATLAALASAEGTLDLAAPAKRYHPALAGAPLGEASVLDLGAYSADCLPLQFPDTVQTAQQVVEFFRHWQPRAAAGTQRCYSNPSLGLFGDLAARAQHQPFSTLMSEGLLAKMGLQNTYLQVPADARGLYAQGYDASDRPVRVGPGPYADEAYGIKTSASDLLRYVRLYLQPEGLPPALAQATTITRQGYFQVGAMTQGLGWERYPYPVTLATLVDGNSSRLIREPQATTRLQPALPALSAAWYNKTGSTNGFGAYAAFVPAERLAIVLLANRNYPNEARVRAAFEILSGL